MTRLSEVLANGNTSGATDAVITAGQKITTDTIGETTAAAGVTIDSVLLKDDVVNATDIETSTISANDGTTAINIADSTGAVDIDTSLNVDGTVTADGLTVDGVGSLTSSSTELLDLTSTGGDSLIRFGSLNSNFDVRIGSPSNPSTANGSFVVRTAGDDRLLVASNGDISFYEDQGTTAKFVWKSADERLGIGTDSPTDKLNISSGTNQIGLDTGDQATYGTLDLGHFTNGAFIGTQAGSNTVSNLLRLGTSGTERMRIDALGNVGIGVVPSAWGDSSRRALQVNSASIDSTGISQVLIRSNNYYDGSDSIYVNTAAAAAYQQLSGVHTWFNAPSGTAGNPITFSEAMRIDSSGNAIIGGTSAGQDGAVTLSNTGYIQARIDNDTVAYFDRTGAGDDGEVIRIQQNGSTVGSIGSASGTTTYIDGGSQFAGLQFGGDGSTEGRITPRRNGASADAATDLGTSSLRFKDLYLSNAVVQDGVKATTTATTQVAIETFAHADHDGAKVVITAATSADTYVTELLIATNGTTAVATEYGQIGTGSALATYDVDISGADVRILATPASTTSTTFRVAMTLT